MEKASKSFDPVGLSSRLDALRARIKKSCQSAGRDASEVKLMAVTKTWPAAAVREIRRLGVRFLGENRVQEAAAKRSALQEDPMWELIGHLQRNKAKLAIELFRRIQSVDSPKLIQTLDRLAGEQGKSPFPVLLQINAGADPGKSGALLDDAPDLVAAALDAGNLNVEGFMTIAPLDDDPEVARRCFRNLRRFRDEMEQRFGRAFPEISMGMSGDMDIAIKEGSTMVRVGSAIFGER